jgi:LPXTG-site transpeptidase (sortase) family protein
MTAVIDPPSEVVESGVATLPAAAPAPAPALTPTGRGPTVGLQVCIAVGLLGALVIGLLAYVFGLSGLSEAHAQSTLRQNFAYKLSQAVAPVGPVAPGTPVAALTIPQLGLAEAVVVEGTTAQDLAAGPGHRRDTVLPGQAGVSVIYGKRTTFGAPFAHLERLQVGDVITAVTGQGTARYRVSSFGDSTHPAPANSANRLILVTADSGIPPHGILTVSADLISKPQPSEGVLPAVPSDEVELGGTAGSLLPLLLWSQALLLLAIGVPIAAHRWSTAATYLCAAPIALAVLWNLYENIALLLPNMY